jgi:Haem-NO-binding
MYGMVQLGMEAMVTQHHGARTWEAITERAGHPDLVTVSNQPYPDDLTYGLVGAACEVLEVDAPSLLRDFGRYWVAQFADEHYSALLEATGYDVPTFMGNLNNLHVRVGLLVPGYRPPRFEVTDLTDDGLTMHYFSEREGLAPFVEGLLVGIGDRFGRDLAVEHVSGRDPGLDHEVFTVRW